MADALRTELALTPEQQKEVDAAFEELRKAYAGVRGQDQAARREAAQAARARLVERIIAILTPEQRARFEALRTRLAEGRGERGATQTGRVYILTAGKPEAITVRLGATDGGVTEVTSNRLQAGTEVIIGGGPRPAEGAAAPAAPQQRGPRFGF
jgi:HlyD family secretion protein